MNFFLLSLIVPFSAHASDIDLFRIRKAILPQNEIMLQARVSPDCNVSDIDFMYYVNVNPENGQPQEKRRLKSGAEQKFRDRFQLSQTGSENAAACPRDSRDCHTLSIRSTEFDWVEHGLRDPSVVIRSEKSDASCKSKALLDLNGKPVVLKSVKVNADNIHYGLFGADFHVISLELSVEGQQAPIIWKCEHACDKHEGL